MGTTCAISKHVHLIYSTFVVVYRATGNLFQALDAALRYSMQVLLTQALLAHLA